MNHHTSGAGGEKRRSGKNGAYDPRFVQRGERINPQSTENFSSSFLIRGVVIINVASGCACEYFLHVVPLRRLVLSKVQAADPGTSSNCLHFFVVVDLSDGGGNDDVRDSTS